MLHWHLLAGPLPALLLVAAAIAAVFLLLAGRRTRRWWTIALPASLAGSVALTLVLDWLVEDVWRPFPDPLPTPVLVWSAVIFAGIGLTVATLIHPGWRRRVGVVVAVLLVAAASLNQINREYGYYPDLAAVVGQRLPQQVPLPPLTQAAARHGDGSSLRGTGPGTGTGPAATVPTSTLPASAAPARAARAPRHGPEGVGWHGAAAPLIRTWHPAGKIPAGGVVSQVTIPGTVSHFSARPAWVYLPPAYLMTPRPNLPVLMLIAGQPGGPKNWIDGGDVITTMDAFAAKHHGLAPIVVMPDATGSTTGNPMCIDSNLGHSATYLATDVVNWVRSHLQVDPAPAHWAVGGFSYGGTCAWQLTVAHPAEFPTFVDISGSEAPTRGSAHLSADKAFGGDLAKLDAAMPMTIMKADRANPPIAAQLRRVAGMFVVGREDGWHVKELEDVMQRCARAGIAVRHLTEPGSHSWYVASMALRDSLTWLTGRMGLA